MSNPQDQPRVEQLRKMPFKQSLVGGTFSNIWERIAGEEIAVKNIRQRGASLADPQVMTSFRKDVMPTMGLAPEKFQFLEQMLKQAFPESFATSSQQIAQSFQTMSGPLTAFQQSLMGINQPLNDSVNSLLLLPPALQPIPQQFADLGSPLNDSKTSLIDLYNAARPVPPSLFGITNSASEVASSLTILSGNIAAWKPPAVSGEVPGGPIQVPGVKPETNAKGGTVMSSGLSFIHTGERITPSNTVRTQDSLTQTLISTVAMMRDRERSFERNSNFVNTIANTVFPSRQPASSVTVVKSYNQGPDSNDVMWKGPSRAIGGVVERDGMAMVHRGNVITPARVTRGLEGFTDLMSLARSSDQTNSTEPGILNLFPKFGNDVASPTDGTPDFAGRSMPSFSPQFLQNAGSSPVTIHVTIEAPLTIQTNGAIDPNSLKEIQKTHERQIETLREMVETKLDPRELNAMLERDMRSSRQRD